MNIEEANIAGVVLTFNRPHYTYKMVKSLSRCIDINDIDWYFFQDGAVNPISGERRATDNEIERNINIIKSIDIPNKIVQVNQCNISVGLQRDQMFNLFDEDYDLILQFEDDVILGKYAVYILKIIMDQYDNACASIYRDKAYDKINNPEENLDLILWSDKWNFFTFGIWEKEFRQFENRWNEYIDILEDYDYMNRPHDKINEKFNSGVSSNDAVLGSIFEECNIRRLKPAISRASYIGREGIHYSPKSYKQHDHGQEGPLTFEQDSELQEFRLQKKFERE